MPVVPISAGESDGINLLYMMVGDFLKMYTL